MKLAVWRWLSFVPFVILLAGCPSAQPPTPQDTRVQRLGADGSNRGNFQIPSEVSVGNDGGQLGDGELLPRDTDFNAAAMDGSGLGMNADAQVFFDFNQSAIRPEDRPALQDMAQQLQDDPALKLLIEGHCDWRGTEEFNLALGERRANSVKQYLITLGIDPARIETVSRGDIEALTEGSEEAMARDRRADLILVP